MFTHQPLVKLNIERIDSPLGRRYKTDTGQLFESVTTWLSRTKDDDYLIEWRERIGEKEADKITRRAAGRGTRLHENVERYLKNEVVKLSEMSMFDRALFKPFTNALNNHVNNIKAIEYPLYSLALRLAGTVDCIAEYDGVLSIIDFKTAKARKNKEDISSYFLQTSIYSYMVEELYGIKIDKMVIIMALDYENKVQIFEESRKIWRPELVRLIKEYPPK